MKLNVDYRVFSRDVIKTKEPPMFLSSLGIRGTNFISVYNFPAQFKSLLRLEPSAF